MMTLDNKLPLHRCRRRLKRRPVDELQHLITLNLKTYFVENNGRFRMPRLLVTTRPLETMNKVVQRLYRRGWVSIQTCNSISVHSYQNVLQHFTLLLGVKKLRKLLFSHFVHLLHYSRRADSRIQSNNQIQFT